MMVCFSFFINDTVVHNGMSRYTYAADGRKLRAEYRLNNFQIIDKSDASGNDWAEQGLADGGMVVGPGVSDSVKIDNPNYTTLTVRDYCGNYIYKNGKLERILTDNGYMQDGGLYFYIKDYQGNVRVVLDQRNRPVELNAYYPYSMLMASTPSDSHQPHKYGTKELDRENGLDWYDFLARQMDPAVPRFTTIDKKAEDYYAISPYTYCAANPIAYIDPNGEKIYVSNEYVDMFLEDLQAVFGEYTSGFSFNEGYLQYTGDSKGMTKEQKELLKGIVSLIESTETTDILYADHLIISDASGAKKVLSSCDSGGEGTLLISDYPQLDKNIVYISPKPADSFTVEEVLPNYYNTYDVKTNTIHSNGLRNFNKNNVRTNRSDLLFHSMGHILYAGKPQNKVIDFNNLARKSLNLPKRKYDEDHNSFKLRF